MKVQRLALVFVLFTLLSAACTGAASPTDAVRLEQPTPNVPSLVEIVSATTRWEDSHTTRYYAEIEESNSEKDFKVRVVVADGQVRVAQRMDKDASGNFSTPVDLPPEQAQAYTVDGLLARVRRDATGQGSVPMNMIVAFDKSLGYPAIVRTDALPKYNSDGQLVLDRSFSYDLSVSVKSLLEDTIAVGRKPVFTLFESGGDKALCATLRIFEDGSSAYTDDCGDVILQMNLPAHRMQTLQDLRATFASLDEIRQVGGVSQRLVIPGTGTGTASPETLQAVWDLVDFASEALSTPVGVGLTVLFEQGGHVYGFDVYRELAQRTEIPAQGNIRAAASSLDDKYLAFSDDNGLHALDLGTMKATNLLPAPEQGAYLPRLWSASGRLLVSQTGATDAQPQKLGWVTVEEGAWHDLPLPEGSSGYGCDTGVAWSPDGARLAITGLRYGDACNTSPGLVVVDLDSGTARRIVAPALADGMVAGTHTPAWSPDGQWIAFGLDQEPSDPLVFPVRLYRVHPDGSDLVPLTNNSRGEASHPAWAPDASLYYALNGAGTPEDGIYHYDPVDNSHTLLIAGKDLYPVEVTRDGKFLLYFQDGSLNLWNIKDKETVQVAAAKEGVPTVFSGWLFNK